MMAPRCSIETFNNTTVGNVGVVGDGGTGYFAVVDELGEGLNGIVGAAAVISGNNNTVIRDFQIISFFLCRNLFGVLFDGFVAPLSDEHRELAFFSSVGHQLVQG